MQHHIAIIGMSLGFSGNGMPWYRCMFLGFGIVMFFPVQFLTEIGDRIGWEIGWRHVIWLEVVIIGLMVITTMVLMRFYPEMPWFESLGGIIFAALIRGIVWLVKQVSSPDDDL
jgi:hypothetical protein